MITTTLNFSCDVDGCGSESETKEVLGMGFGGLPKGWAMLNWITEKVPGADDPKMRFVRAVRKLKPHISQEIREYNDAAAGLFTEGLEAPQQVSCKAIICDKCLDKINLGDFQTNQSGGLY
jgi:hypothetical protein